MLFRNPEEERRWQADRFRHQQDKLQRPSNQCGLVQEERGEGGEGIPQDPAEQVPVGDVLRP